jgi:hypothetical protein
LNPAQQDALKAAVQRPPQEVGVSAEYLWVARSRQDVLPSPAEFGVIFAPRPLLTQLGQAVRAAATSQTSAWLAPLREAARPDTGNRLL